MKILSIALAGTMTLLMIGCGEKATKTNQGASELNNDTTFASDLEGAAALALADDLVNAPEAVEASDDDLDEGIKAKAADLLAKADLNGDGKIDQGEKDKFREEKLKARKAEIDTNNDGVISKEEIAAHKQKVKDKLATIKKSHEGQGWEQRKAELCKKADEKVAALGDESRHHPMLDRVIARCAQINDIGEGPLPNNRGAICEKVDQMVKSFGNNAPKGLQMIAAKCKDGVFGKDAPRPKKTVDKPEHNDAKPKLGEKSPEQTPVKP